VRKQTKEQQLRKIKQNIVTSKQLEAKQQQTTTF
jgi:hypothetical protein